MKLWYIIFTFRHIKEKFEHMKNEVNYGYIDAKYEDTKITIRTQVVTFENLLLLQTSILEQK